MVYPVLEIRSIIERFEKDIADFTYKYNILDSNYLIIPEINEALPQPPVKQNNNNNRRFRLFSNDGDPIPNIGQTKRNGGVNRPDNQIKRNGGLNRPDNQIKLPPNALITAYEEGIINNLKKIVKYIDNLLGNGNYVDNISSKDEQTQLKLWIARTYLFYQLLILLTISLSNQVVYNEIFKDIPFRDDIPIELPNFKLGIFGSITPTSDIDLGIQYSGTTLAIPGLAYIVSRFEILFVTYTTPKSSLAYDIETYADMITLPIDMLDKITYRSLPAERVNEVEPPLKEGNAKEKYDDFFYLNSSNFNINHFKKILSCAAKSIIRNFLLSIDTKSLTEDAETQKAKLNSLTFNEIYNHSLFFNIDHLLSDNIKEEFNNGIWFNNVKQEMFKFLMESYDEQRKLYYEKVDIAEQLKFQKISTGKLSDDDICDIMVAIGDALSYRMESYTCVPSIVHIVRILQASKDKQFKYATLIPNEFCTKSIKPVEPMCSIGSYGYIISILEQMGYTYRFHLTYCDTTTSHFNELKCLKKEKKYINRYTNGIIGITKFIPKYPIFQRTTILGGNYTKDKNKKKIKIKKTNKYKKNNIKK